MEESNKTPLGDIENMKEKKRLWKDSEGSAYAWMVVLVVMFVLFLVWATFSEPIQQFYMLANNSTYGTQFNQPVQWMAFVWTYYPVIMLGGMILWAIAYSVYREAGRWQY